MAEIKETRKVYKLTDVINCNCVHCAAQHTLIVTAIDLDGGHRTNWQDRMEYDFARANIYATCYHCHKSQILEIEVRG